MNSHVETEKGGIPLSDASGIRGSRCAHSASLRPLGYQPRSRRDIRRCSSVQIPVRHRREPCKRESRGPASRNTRLR